MDGKGGSRASGMLFGVVIGIVMENLAIGMAWAGVRDRDRRRSRQGRRPGPG
ncbi:hypothetical protein [Polymorphospora lycopeni]|uniref:Uncharacterized protein n=1 Tax=Polymorphospora lycopeni TaxID=3140240 RepID=A0ABV5D169_9ACTN